MSAEELLVTPAQPPAPGLRTDTRPRALTFVSISRDGRHMLLVDDAGGEFTVEIDHRLRAGLPADSPRRSEPPVNNAPSSLRPRDIQTRIRAGESAEEVAAAAGTTVEKIMAFAGPVLAEREHMAERAQKASVRRRAGDAAGTARTLGQAVAAHLHTIDLEPEVLVWDSYRRTDGRWKLTATYDTPVRAGTAELTFDPQGFYVALDNDDARWLVGDRVEVVSEVASPLRDDLEAARQRRQQPAAPATPAAPTVSSIEDTVETPLGLDTPVEAYLFEDPAPDAELPQEAQPEEPVSEEPVVEEPVAEDRPARRTSRRRRASVPSWDEIMFGGGRSE